MNKMSYKRKSGIMYFFIALPLVLLVMIAKKYFTMSFDDGVEQDKTVIALMKQYGIKGTFNLSAGLFGKQHRIARIYKIPKDEITQVYDGFEVASHGYKHEMFRYMTREKIEDSLSRDIRELSNLMGYQIAGHAYPYDMHTQAAEEYFRKTNLLYARKVLGKGLNFRFPDNPYKSIATCHFNAKNILELFEKFIKAEPVNENLLFMTWGHSYELDKGFRSCPPPQLEQIFSKIAGRKDIIYCTSKEAFESNSGRINKPVSLNDGLFTNRTAFNIRSNACNIANILGY